MLDFSRLCTLPDVLAYHAQMQPEQIATEFQGRSTTYRELHLRSDALARTLLQLHPAPRSRVAYLGKNSDRYFELMFAVAKAGKVLVPLNWRLTLDEWSYILDDADATCLFTDSSFSAAGKELAERLPLTARVPIDGSWDYLFNNDSTETIFGPFTATDIALQIYTSGTTGKPKGVLLSHTNILALREPVCGPNLNGLRAKAIQVLWSCRSRTLPAPLTVYSAFTAVGDW